MYSLFRRACERVLRIPHDPAPPPGDEASARVFRAAPAYFKYRLALWAIGAAFALFFGVVFLGGMNLVLMADKHVPGAVRAIVFTWFVTMPGAAASSLVIYALTRVFISESR